MIREQNHEISQIYSKGLSEYEDKVEALDNLYKFYKAIDLKKSQLLNTKVDGTIEMEKIKVTENYQETVLTSTDYINLRFVSLLHFLFIIMVKQFGSFERDI